MTNTIAAAQVELSVNADGVEAGVNKARNSVKGLGRAAREAGKEASDGIGEIGKSGAQSADKIDAATKRTIASIERQTLAMGKSKAEYYAAQAAINGNSAALAPYIQKMKEAEAANAKSASSMSSFSKAAIAAGAAVAAGVFTNMIKGAIDAADNMNDLSKTTSLTVEQLYGLKLAATQSGTNLDGVAKAVSKLSVNMGKNAKDFAAIGISAKDPLEALKQLSDVFVSIEDPQKRAAFAAKALGKSWEEIAPLLSEGGDAIGEMVEKGKGLAGATQDMADGADQFNDKLAELNSSIGKMVGNQAAGLLPLLNVIVEDMNDAASSASDLDSSFNPLAESLKRLVVVGGGFAFTAHQIAVELGGLYAMSVSLATFDFKGAFAIGDAMKADTEKAIAGFVAWENKVLGAGKTVATAADKQAEAIAKLDAKYFAGAISAEKYASGLAKLTGQQQAASAGSNKAIDNFVREEKAQKGAVDAGEKYLETLKKETAALTLNESQKRMIAAADAAQKTSNVALRKEIMATALAYEYKTQAIQDAIDAEKMQNGQTDAYIALLNQREMAESDATKTLEDLVKSVEADTFALTANVEEIKNHNIQLALQKSGLSATSDAFIEYKKRLEDAYSNQTVAKAAKDAQDEWQKSSDEINRSLTDALMRGFESGKGFGQNLVDTIKNMFNTMVLRPIISAIVSPVSGMVSSAMGSMGFAGQASAGTDYLGMASNGSTMNSMYNMATGAGQNALSYGAFGTSAANVTGGNMVMTGSAQEMMLAEQGMGGYTAVSPASGLAAYGGAALGAYYGYQQHGIGGAAAYGAAGYVGGAAVAGGMAAAGGGAAAAGAGAMSGASAALAAIPVWGWIALAAIAILGWDAVGETRSGGSYAMGEGFDRNTQDYGSFDTSASTFTQGPSGGEVSGTKEAVDYTIGGINTLLAQLGSSSTLVGFQAGMESSDKDRGGVYSGGTLSDGTRFGETGEGSNYSGGVYENTSAKSGDAAEMGKLFIEDLMQVTIQALQAATDLPQNVMDYLSNIDAEALTEEAASGVLAMVQVLNASAQNMAIFGAEIEAADLGAFAAQGEDLYQTYMRLADVFTLSSSVAEMFGRDVEDAFGGIGLASTEMRQSLIDGAGGMEAIAAKANGFYQNFFTDSEKNATVTANAMDVLNATFSEFGLTVPATHQAYKDLAASLLDGTETGQAAWQAIMNVSGAFIAVNGTAQDAAIAAQQMSESMDAATEAAASAAKAAIDAMIAAFANSAADGLGDAFGLLSRSVAADRAILTGEYESSLSGFNEQLRSITDSVSRLSALSQELISTLDKMRIIGSESESRKAAQAQISDALSIARSGGGLPLDGQLSSALAAVSKPSEKLFSTYEDYARDFYRTANDISALEELTGEKLSEAETTKSLLESQIRILTDTYDGEMARLDAIISGAQAQIDAMNGIDSSISDLADAIKALSGATLTSAGAAVSSAQAGQITSAAAVTTVANSDVAKDQWATLETATGPQDVWASSGGSVGLKTETGVDIYTQAGDYFTAAEAIAHVNALLAVGNEMQIYLDAIKYGVSASSLDALMGWSAGTSNAWAIANNLPTFAAGGLAMPGWAMVGEEGPELVNFSQPGRVYTAADTQHLMGGSGNTEMIQELRALRDEVANLRHEARATANHTSKTASMLERAMPDGDALATRVAA